jgi:hypothetical protein
MKRKSPAVKVTHRPGALGARAVTHDAPRNATQQQPIPPAGAPDRVKEMYRLYTEDSLSLADVGAHFNLTRQRVSQLFQRAGLPARAHRVPKGSHPPPTTRK